MKLPVLRNAVQRIKEVTHVIDALYSLGVEGSKKLPRPVDLGVRWYAGVCDALIMREIGSRADPPG